MTREGLQVGFARWQGMCLRAVGAYSRIYTRDNKRPVPVAPTPQLLVILVPSSHAGPLVQSQHLDYGGARGAREDPFGFGESHLRASL